VLKFVNDKRGGTLYKVTRMMRSNSFWGSLSEWSSLVVAPPDE